MQRRKTVKSGAVPGALKTHLKTRFKPEKVRQIIKLYVGGQSLSNLAIRYGAARNSLRRLLERNGVNLRSQKDAFAVSHKNPEQGLNFEKIVKTFKRRHKKKSVMELVNLYEVLNQRIGQTNALIQIKRKTTIRDKKQNIIEAAYLQLLNQLGNLRAQRQAVFELLPDKFQERITSAGKVKIIKGFEKLESAVKNNGRQG